MNIALTTPALLFPAISLLLLAYTNRFLTLAQLIRQLHAQKRQDDAEDLSLQIENLRKRMNLTILMQALGVISIILCTLSMIFIYVQWPNYGSLIFGLSLLAMILSLLVSLWEIVISGKALDIELDDMKKDRFSIFKSKKNEDRK
jgi:hypothetical protein